ncbi:MAG TPA: hypothetical protein VMV56_07615 [Williamwhitmania sp.]|nr:hypothetical protein [Williamwhitmania sp.]
MKIVVKKWTNFKRFPEFLRQDVVAALNFAAELLAGEVRETTSVGATGNARRETRSESAFIRGNQYVGVVGNAVPYINALEEGTDAHWVPIAHLLYWAKRKLGDENIAYPVQKAIAKHGTKGQYMFKTAEKKMKNQIKGMIKSAVKSAERKIR